MYAVFQSGGKQYRVNEGQIIRLEKLNFLTGETINFDKILIISKDEKTRIGTPFIQNSKINAKIIAHGRNKKIKIIKFSRRKHYRKKQGHRQWFTDVQITKINFLN
ncbi:50S ribosomal protein L21 [Serratia symbiotica]|nr:50S ribosomal protein L21 [Serratia symbiotica]